MAVKHTPFIKPDESLINIVLNHLSSFYPLSEDLEKKFREKLFEVKVAKGTYLLKEGEISEYLYFILRGVIIGYTTRGDKKLTTYICLDGDTVSSISGMYGAQPSDENMYVVEDSHLIGLPISDLLCWLETSLEMNIIIRKILESFYKSAHERSNLVRMGTAQEKYEYYISTVQHQADRISPEYIADFLDIKPATFQKIVNQQFTSNSTAIEKQCGLIKDYIINQQAFKQQGLTLYSMARALSIPAHQLSYILNVHYKKRFSAFINGFRIDYIKSKLQSTSEWQHFKIEALGVEGGFSSRSAFFAEFKIHTGMSPAEYARSYPQT